MLSKVIGTVSLGILAGSTASTTYNLEAIKETDGLEIYKRARKLTAPVAITAFTSLIGAYVFAPAAGRHPYLLYSALSVPILGALNRFLAPKVVTVEAPKKLPKPEEEVSMLDNSVYAKLEESDQESETSEESVRSAAISKHHLYRLGLWSSVVSGIAFIVSTVGIYGDLL